MIKLFLQLRLTLNKKKKRFKYKITQMCLINCISYSVRFINCNTIYSLIIYSTPINLKMEYILFFVILIIRVEIHNQSFRMFW